MYCWRDNFREFQWPGLKQKLGCKWQKNSRRTCCLILLIEIQSLVHEVLLKQNYQGSAYHSCALLCKVGCQMLEILTALL